MLVYLAGTISYFNKINKLEFASLWRKLAKENLSDLDIKVFDPMKNFAQNNEYDLKGVPYQNLYYLEKSDIILLNLEALKESPGTMFVIFIAWYNHKPVIAFGESELISQPHIKEAITSKFKNLPDACDYIKSMYCQ
jgi:nucleoside 2-deoxyribosyltransferase